MVKKRKLIEVALPLEAINRESAREKSIKHGHPSSLHLYWARRPLATARAVLFAQLVDDPSSHPDRFTTEEAQRAERERLHEIIARLVVWENLQDDALLREAHAEIVASIGGNPPPVLDPFAGGGTIPLEAQRLGLDAHAADLNPVAVLINKALIDLPPRFRGTPPVYPGLAESQFRAWTGADGLAADVRAYATWLRDEAEQRVGKHYPTVDGETVIAWIWARTVRCPNPACGAETPLVNSFTVSRKRNRPVHVRPSAEGSKIAYNLETTPSPTVEGTVTRSGARCLVCDASMPLPYVRSQGRAGRLGRHLISVVTEGNRRRNYRVPSPEHVVAAEVPDPGPVLATPLPERALGFRVQAYGLKTQDDFYSPRQRLMLKELVELIPVAREKMIADGGSVERADALCVYLALLVGRVANRSSSQCFWDAGGEKVQQVFARNAMPMIWVYAESNPFSDSSGNILGQLDYLVNALERLPLSGTGAAIQRSATDLPMTGYVISTDPPYYDNVPYADLSDFFYAWHRLALRAVLPEMYGTLTTPKAEELIAEPARHDSAPAAARFFESGLRGVFSRISASHPEDVPFTIYYAFKQSETDETGTASTGWETMLQALTDSPAVVTGTWPVRTELAGGLREVGRNALASSVVIAARRRPENAPTTDRRGLIHALEAELPAALRRLQQGQVAPVDLPQAAIGPGMAVFSRYAAVLEPDGTSMSVRSALARINEVLDEVLSEQEGDFDAPSRFAIAWYRQHGYGVGKFGDADSLARARNTSVDVMDRDEILTSRAGSVQLTRPAELSWDYDVLRDSHTSNWEALHHLIRVLERDGIAPAGEFLQAALARQDGAVDADLVKELAHLLFRIAEGNGWTKDALSFNNLVTSWPEILEVARSKPTPVEKQFALDFDGDE